MFTSLPPEKIQLSSTEIDHYRREQEWKKQKESDKKTFSLPRPQRRDYYAKKSGIYGDIFLDFVALIELTVLPITIIITPQQDLVFIPVLQYIGAYYDFSFELSHGNCKLTVHAK